MSDFLTCTWDLVHELTVRLIVCSLPQYFPRNLPTGEYINSCEGIRLTATRLLFDSIQMTTSGTEFWGCAMKRGQFIHFYNAEKEFTETKLCINPS